MPVQNLASTSRGSRPKVVTTTLAATAAGALLIAGLSSVTAASVSAAPTAKVDAKSKYIVVFDDAPVARYDGGVAGIARTAPAKGASLDPSTAAATRYRSYLVKRQSQALARVGGAKVLTSYTDVLSGVGVELTASQASKLKYQRGVMGVFANEIRKVDTSRTPAFLGLTGHDGAWDKLGGTSKAGKDVIVGVVDSGIWPESASFAPLRRTSPAPAGWAGSCQTGEEWTASLCTNKIIGAKYFVNGFGGPAEILPEDYLSPRDGDGHGTHTASTAAGNYGVTAIVDGTNLGKISGMAPAARIAVYKVCWNGDAGGCSTMDSVDAIDTAVADGVDVINYSISGNGSTNLDPVAISFLNAAAAGVFVSASAGNSGPAESTLNHNSPWVTTVAAGTHDRDGSGTVTLGNGVTYNGKSAQRPALASAPVVLSTDAGLAGQDPNDVRLCALGTLDPAVVAGKIVLCDRGVVARTDKSLEVKNAGGVGMILANTGPNSVNADLHFVPTIHVDNIVGGEIKAYLAATAAPTASLSAGAFVFGVQAPFVAAFSSRGPGLVADQDMIKPDIMAPGEDILASVAPPSNYGRSFDFYSGTSMSAPHIAGIGALVKGEHPDWSPMAIKSALMSTANTKDNKGVALDGTPFDFGAGQVNPTRAIDAGLVFDSGELDFYGYLCATELGNGFCDYYGIPNFDASDFNLASIGIGSLAGQQSVVRTVTQTSKGKGRWVPSVSAPAGVSVTVSPRSVELRKGQSATFTVTFTRTTAPLDEWAFGTLNIRNTRDDDSPRLHAPIAVRPVALSVPGEVAGGVGESSVSFTAIAGYTGALSSSVAGLVAADEQSAPVSGADGGSFDPSTPSSHTAHFTVDVAAGTNLARFATFGADYAANDDLDVFVFKDGAFVGQSAGGTAEERVDVVSPAAGVYDVYVDAFSLTVDPTTTTLYSWELGSADAGNLTVTAPTTVTLAGSVPISLSWGGLTPGQHWLGEVTWTDGTNPIGSTMVSVDS